MTVLDSDRWGSIARSFRSKNVSDVSVDADGRVYLLIRDRDPVVVLDRDGSVLGRWGSNVFTTPHGITVGPDSHVYCVDSGDHTLRKFTLGGELVGVVGVPHEPSDTGYTRAGDGPEYLSIERGGPPFNGPTKACVLESGDIYVADGYGNARVHHFSASGEHVSSWGEPGTAPGQFRLPHSIVATADGSRLLVCDRENDRIQVFSFDGQLVDIWSGLHRPCSAAVRSDGVVYVAELGNRAGIHPSLAVTNESPWSQCAVLSPDGTLIKRWGTPDPCGPGSFFAAHGIAVDGDGILYVTEVAWAAGLRRPKGTPACCQTFHRFEPVSLGPQSPRIS